MDAQPTVEHCTLCGNPLCGVDADGWYPAHSGDCGDHHLELAELARLDAH